MLLGGKFGLGEAQLAKAMGYNGHPGISNIERMLDDVPGQAARLMQAYLARLRPIDWLTGVKGAEK